MRSGCTVSFSSARVIVYARDGARRPLTAQRAARAGACARRGGTAVEPHPARLVLDRPPAPHFRGGRAHVPRPWRSAAIYDDSPLQRRFRDEHTATAHFQVNPATWELTGRLRLDQPTETVIP
jgi:hypothetical protein